MKLPKCPACGDENDQQQLAPDERGEIGYRCAGCGRLYSVPVPSKNRRAHDEPKKNGTAHR